MSAAEPSPRAATVRRTALLRTLRSVVVFGVPLLVVTAIANATFAPADQRVMVNFLIALVLVLAIQTFSGNSGIITFGHVAFMGVGAYVAALATIPPAVKKGSVPDLPSFILDAELGFLPAVALAAGVTAVIALAVGIALTRMEENAMAMATIGVLVIAFVVFESWDAVTRGAQGLFGVPTQTTMWWGLAFAVGAIAVARYFRESRAGLRLRASREDALAAGALGVDVVRLRLVAWVLSGALMGAGGALWAQYNLAFGPRQFFFAQTFSVLAMIVVGGLASVSGAVLGATVVTIASETLRRIEDGGADVGPLHIPGQQGMTPIALSLLILLVLRWRRDGLVGLFEIDDAIARLRRRPEVS
jgi:branched-chain amino acid transport system permease protein